MRAFPPGLLGLHISWQEEGLLGAQLRPGQLVHLLCWPSPWRHRAPISKVGAGLVGWKQEESQQQQWELCVNTVLG